MARGWAADAVRTSVLWARRDPWCRHGVLPQPIRGTKADGTFLHNALIALERRGLCLAGELAYSVLFHAACGAVSKEVLHFWFHIAISYGFQRPPSSIG